MSSAEVVAEVQFDGRGSLKLTDRDRQLMLLLLICRYLTTDQITRLFFPGRTVQTILRRLRLLAGLDARTRDTAFLRRLEYRDYAGAIVRIWALHERGHAYLGPGAVRGAPPRFLAADLSSNLREHAILTNELLVGLLAPAAPGQLARALHPGFRWVPTEWIKLPWETFDPRRHMVEQRALKPDAILELTAQKRRVFIELETGSNPLLHPKKKNSTTAKLERYAAFLSRFASAADKVTWYARAFPDNWPADVAIVTTTPGRRESVTNVIASWRPRGAKVSALAFTIEEAVAHFRRLVGVPPALPLEAVSPTRKRKGAGLSPDDVALLERFVGESVTTIQAVRHAVRRRDPLTAEPDYPASYKAVMNLIARLKT